MHAKRRSIFISPSSEEPPTPNAVVWGRLGGGGAILWDGWSNSSPSSSFYKKRWGTGQFFGSKQSTKKYYISLDLWIYNNLSPYDTGSFLSNFLPAVDGDIDKNLAQAAKDSKVLTTNPFSVRSDTDTLLRSE